MGKPAHHTLDIYGTHLHAAFDHNGWKRLRRMDGELDKARTLGYGMTVDTRDSDTDHQHVWIFVDRAKCGHVDELIDTLAHEAVHAAMFILNRHCIDLDASRGEPLAYLTGWLTDWLWRNAI